MGSGPEQLGSESESGWGDWGMVWILRVGRRGRDNSVVQYEGHMCRATGSETGSRSIAGHDELVSENPVYLYPFISSHPNRKKSKIDILRTSTKSEGRTCQGSLDARRKSTYIVPHRYRKRTHISLRHQSLGKTHQVLSPLSSTWTAPDPQKDRGSSPPLCTLLHWSWLFER